MSEKNESERDADHPLFRALVLMGGGLALSCGGSVVVEGNATGGGGARAVGGAPQGGVSPGGASYGGGEGALGGAGALGGGGASAVDAGAPDCPPAQWDCTALGLSCSYYFMQQTRPEGCVCDPKRPKSVADCAPNESLFCLSASGDPPFTDPQSWDGTRHVQCTCVPAQSTPFAYPECSQECATTYPALDRGGIYSVSCNMPQPQTCDPYGNNCTATPASVLRQDGIVCGCASVILK